MSRKKGTGVPERGGRQTRTQDQTKSQNVKGTIAKGREGHMVRKPPLEQGRKNNQSDILNDKLEPPREQSLENIFAMEVETNTQLRNSSTQPLLIDTNLTDQVIYTRDVQPDRTDRINVGYNDIDVNRQGANASGIGNSKLGNLPMSTVMTVEEGLSKNIRGRFKREVYGEDELKKRENQSRMKRELEQQMNQNKIKKENEKRRKDEDDRIEHERVQRYRQEEEARRLEAERKEAEVKRQKEMFNAQQLTILQEYQAQNNLDKKSKIRRNIQPGEHMDQVRGGVGLSGYPSQPPIVKMLSLPAQSPAHGIDRQKIDYNSIDSNNRALTDTHHGMDPNNTHSMQHQFGITGATYNQLPDCTSSFYPDRQIVANTSVSPPSDHFSQPQFTHNQTYQFQRQITPLTNFSTSGTLRVTRDSVPVQKNVLENLLMENQGLKQEAGRNTIILDFLTSEIA